MKFSSYFVDRPILALVLSLILFISGGLALFWLPISEYPDVVPATVVVTTRYPGANPTVIAQTVAAPLEEAINGAEGLLYVGSQATGDGALKITATFKVGTNAELAESRVQSRVQRVLPRLPEDVRRVGVTTQKSLQSLAMVVHLHSPKQRYGEVYIRNYANINIKDKLARISGVGQLWMFGAGEYAMRVWLDPRKMAARNITAPEVVMALREQNVQVAAGVIGASPAPGAEFQIALNSQGRLSTEEEFAKVVVKRSKDGVIVRLQDVARLELGAAEYALRSLLNNKPAVSIGVFQAPQSNALQLAKDVRAEMARLKENFPQDLEYDIVYDPTRFVSDSIVAVVKTLAEAIALVVLVVIMFLQTWRASIIPLLAVPVSVMGTFVALLAFGFSVNTLSLFGLVLAIGIVVDDAIVVVENVERNIARGLNPREATLQAMKEVSGPIIAIALVLCAVFVPIAFVSGLSGQFYRQFALTIAFSTIISAFNSLTLSPALAAILLKSHETPKDRLSLLVDRLFGRAFRRFNTVFERSSNAYGRGVAQVVRHKALSMSVYLAIIGAAVLMFKIVPTGFVPPQDKQYLVGFAQLPEAASLDRTEGVIRRMSEVAKTVPGVKDAVAFPGLSVHGFMNAPNSGIVFYTLDDFSRRQGANLTGEAIAGEINKRLSTMQDAFIMVFPPPPVDGLGTIGGFKLYVQDRGNLGQDVLYQSVQALQAKAWQAPQLAGVFSGYQINVPQLDVSVDRTAVQQMGVPLSDVFETMQINLGSLYVNDFNKFGRTYPVIAQADSPFRLYGESIAQFKVRNADGNMVPLGSLVNIKQSYGPDRVERYNAYFAADFNGGPAPGVSSGQARAVMEKLAKETLPRGIGFEWTDLTYQEMLAGNTMFVIFPLCLLLVFLVLAAQYESWTLPLAVIMIVPASILCALLGVYLTKGDNNIFTQIALFVLVGLASKNAILIVEFARDLERQGYGIVAAALEACRLRLRPIFMTSIAFIMGVLPLVFSTGAGAEMRHAMGVAVFFGMLGVTLFGLFLTPVFYVLLRQFADRLGRGNQTGASPMEVPA
jgi:multidrug efflux pump